MLFPRARRRRRSFGVRGRILNSRRGITHAILPSRKHLSLSLQTCSVVLVVMTKMHRSKLLLRCSLLTLARDPKIILPRPSTLCLPSLNFFLSLSLCIRFFLLTLCRVYVVCACVCVKVPSIATAIAALMLCIWPCILDDNNEVNDFDCVTCVLCALIKFFPYVSLSTILFCVPPRMLVMNVILSRQDSEKKKLV